MKTVLVAAGVNEQSRAQSGVARTLARTFARYLLHVSRKEEEAEES